MTESFEEKLSTILVSNNVITRQEALDLQKNFEGSSKETFSDFLLSEEIVSKDDLLKALGHYYQVPSFDVVGHFFKHDLLVSFPKEFLLKHAIIPLDRDGSILVIVSSQPDNADLVSEIGDYVSDDIQFFVGIKDDIFDAIEEYYDESPFSSDGEIDPADEAYEDAELFEDALDN